MFQQEMSELVLLVTYTSFSTCTTSSTCYFSYHHWDPKDATEWKKDPFEVFQCTFHSQLFMFHILKFSEKMLILIPFINQSFQLILVRCVATNNDKTLKLNMKRIQHHWNYIMKRQQHISQDKIYFLSQHYSIFYQFSIRNS